MGDQIMPGGIAIPSDPDEAERYLIRKIDELRDGYQMRCEPYMQMLIQLRSIRPAPVFITAEQFAEFKKWQEASHG